jgi:hypothetical protein
VAIYAAVLVFLIPSQAVFLTILLQVVNEILAFFGYPEGKLEKGESYV